MKRKELEAMNDTEIRQLLLMTGDEYRIRMKDQMQKFLMQGDREHAGYTLAGHDKLVDALETIWHYC